MSPLGKLTMNTDDCRKLASTIAAADVEPVQLETLNIENVKPHCSTADLYQTHLKEQQLHETDLTSSSQSTISRLIPVPVEHTALSMQQENFGLLQESIHFGLQLEAHSLSQLDTHGSESAQVLQGTRQVCQISQPSITYVPQQHPSNCQQSTLAIQQASAADHSIQSHTASHAPQPAPSSAQVLMTRNNASTSLVRSASHHLKSASTPKVIIVSGTGMSTATTISGPPPPVATSSVASFPPKQSPTKLNVMPIPKAANDGPSSVLSSGGCSICFRKLKKMYSSY